MKGQSDKLFWFNAVANEFNPKSFYTEHVTFSNISGNGQNQWNIMYPYQEKPLL